MKDSSLVISILSLNDITRIDDNTKYINIDISNPDSQIIEYFLKYGRNYMYSDIIDNTCGYTYVSYEEFFRAENIIKMICTNISDDLSELEMARYLYINLAKNISFDINTDLTKCELYDLKLMTNVNNLWGSLAIGRVSDISASKIYYYLCRRMGLSAVLVIDDDKKAWVKLKIKNQILLTNIILDIAFIAANMQTKHFGMYNNDISLDKKIGYIKNNYNDYYLDKLLKDVDYDNEDFAWEILVKTQKVLAVEGIKPMELNLIYHDIFRKYAANYDIQVSNLFLNSHNKDHFIVISYDNKHYSYNYKENSFVKITEDDIIDNLNMGKIGLYLDEFIPNISYTKHLLS